MKLTGEYTIHVAPSPKISGELVLTVSESLEVSEPEAGRQFGLVARGQVQFPAPVVVGLRTMTDYLATLGVIPATIHWVGEPVPALQMPGPVDSIVRRAVKLCAGLLRHVKGV